MEYNSNEFEEFGPNLLGGHKRIKNVFSNWDVTQVIGELSAVDILDFFKGFLDLLVEFLYQQ